MLKHSGREAELSDLARYEIARDTGTDPGASILTIQRPFSSTGRGVLKAPSSISKEVADNSEKIDPFETVDYTDDSIPSNSIHQSEMSANNKIQVQFDLKKTNKRRPQTASSASSRHREVIRDSNLPASETEYVLRGGFKMPVERENSLSDSLLDNFQKDETIPLRHELSLSPTFDISPVSGPRPKSPNEKHLMLSSSSSNIGNGPFRFDQNLVKGKKHNIGGISSCH